MIIKEFIQVAGAVHLFIAAANFFLPAKLHYRENLAKVSPIIREIFVVHSIYIVLVLLGFSAISFFFADDLSGQSPLGRFLSGFLAFFWLLRVAIQVFYYDSAIKQENRFGNALFTTAFLYLGLVFAVSTIYPK